MTAIYLCKLSDGETIHFQSDTNKPIEDIKADAFKTLGRVVVDVIDEQYPHEYGRSTTKGAQYMRTYYAKVKQTQERMR